MVPLKLIIEPATVVSVPPLPKFPWRFSAPVPVNVNCACAAVPEKVTPPVRLIVPVETDTIQFLFAFPLPGIAILVAFNVPEPTAIVLLTAAVGEFMVITPQFRILDPLIVIPLAVPEAIILTVVTVFVVTSTVTTTPALTTTLSPFAGGAEPPQVVLLLQTPVALAVFVAAMVAEAENKTTNNKIMDFERIWNFLSECRLFF
jgi:hypothetical protein